MAYSTSLRKGDYGANIDFVVYDGSTSSRFNVSSTKTTVKAEFYNGYTVNSTKTLTKLGTGSSGCLRYATTNGFLNVAGTWRGQLTVTTTGGVFSSTVFTFTVMDSL